MNIKISVLTPTYNRAKLLFRLYNSLQTQKYQNFEWVIVDDGSVDDTEQVVQSLIAQNEIQIKYYKKQNGGKPAAHNCGVTLLESDLTVICDDDDYLTANALQKINDYWEQYQNNSVGGMIAYKGKTENETLTNKKFSTQKTTAHIMEVFKDGIFDTTQIYRTEILKKNLFPITQGEKFVPEIWLWKKIDREYSLIVMPEILEICEYLEAGLTKSASQNVWNNPTGYAYYFFQEYELTKGFRKIKNYGVYWGLVKISKKVSLQKAPIWIGILSIPVAIAVQAKAFLQSK